MTTVPAADAQEATASTLSDADTVATTAESLGSRDRGEPDAPFGAGRAGSSLRLARQQRSARGPRGRVLWARRDLVKIVAARHGLTNLRVFGSVARGEDHPDSDVDLLADLPSGMGLFGFGRAISDLEEVLRARVDLVPAADLKPGVRDEVEAQALVL